MLNSIRLATAAVALALLAGAAIEARATKDVQYWAANQTASRAGTNDHGATAQYAARAGNNDRAA